MEIVMLLKKKTAPAADQSSPLEAERAKLSGFSELVKLSSLLFTVCAVLSFAAAISSFLLLLTNFSGSVTLAVFGGIFTVLFLAAGLVINDYTKRESDFLCKVKRRPLGYLLRSSVSKRLVITTVGALVLFVFGTAVSVVLFATQSDSLMLIVNAIALVLALCFAAAGFFVSKLSSDYVVNEIEFFDELETGFAKRTHII